VACDAGDLPALGLHGAPTWSNFAGNADGLRVGIGGDVTTFDFEP